MDEKRRRYKIQVEINGVSFNEVIIDPHFEEKHSESIDDQIILGLVK